MSWENMEGVRYRCNLFDGPILVAGPKPWLTEFDIHHRFETCVHRDSTFICLTSPARSVCAMLRRLEKTGPGHMMQTLWWSPGMLIISNKLKIFILKMVSWKHQQEHSLKNCPTLHRYNRLGQNYCQTPSEVWAKRLVKTNFECNLDISYPAPKAQCSNAMQLHCWKMWCGEHSWCWFRPFPCASCQNIPAKKCKLKLILKFFMRKSMHCSHFWCPSKNYKYKICNKIA